MSDTRDVSVYHMLFTIVSILVDHPNDIRITTLWTDDGAVFTVRTHREDTGQLIGRDGRTAQSIRTILGRIAAKLHRRYVVVIDESPTKSSEEAEDWKSVPLSASLTRAVF